MTDMKIRSLAKSISWRILGFLITFGIMWGVTRDGSFSLGTSALIHIIKTIVYYFHERIWDKIEWGRI